MGTATRWSNWRNKLSLTTAGSPPTVLDMFSGRAIIPLEAARAGAVAVGVDLSPVATLAGRLLADYPARDWSAEPPLPFADDAHGGALWLGGREGNGRLVGDVQALLSEVGRRVAERIAPYYPRNAQGEFPWASLWAVTMPCDGCKRRFPLLGSLVLRYPRSKDGDPGQSLRLKTTDGRWEIEIVDGPPTQQPTYTQAMKADGKKKKGKTARCLFCGHVHPLEAVKAKGVAGQYEDSLLAIADTDEHEQAVLSAANNGGDQGRIGVGPRDRLWMALSGGTRRGHLVWQYTHRHGKRIRIPDIRRSDVCSPDPQFHRDRSGDPRIARGDARRRRFGAVRPGAHLIRGLRTLSAASVLHSGRKTAQRGQRRTASKTTWSGSAISL